MRNRVMELDQQQTEQDLRVTGHLLSSPHLLVLHLSDDTQLWCTPFGHRTLQELEVASDAELSPVRLMREKETLQAFSHELMQGRRKGEEQGHLYGVMQAAADYCQVNVRLGIYCWEPEEGGGDPGHLLQYVDGFDNQDAQALRLMEGYMQGCEGTPEEVPLANLKLPYVDVLIFHDFLYTRYLQARQAYLLTPSKALLQAREGVAAAYDRLLTAMEDLGHPLRKEEFTVEDDG
jgi:hypothetical protein